MRLIDADRLKRQVEGRSWRAKDKMVELIDNSPTIEAEPVKHGRWTKIGHIENTWLVSKCSECGYQTIDAGNYCPNCGAQMDLEEGESHDQN